MHTMRYKRARGTETNTSTVRHHKHTKGFLKGHSIVCKLNSQKKKRKSIKNDIISLDSVVEALRKKYIFSGFIAIVTITITVLVLL